MKYIILCFFIIFSCKKKAIISNPITGEHVKGNIIGFYFKDYITLYPHDKSKPIIIPIINNVAHLPNVFYDSMVLHNN